MYRVDFCVYLCVTVSGCCVIMFECLVSFHYISVIVGFFGVGGGGEIGLLEN